MGAMRTIGGGEYCQFDGNESDVTAERLKSRELEAEFMRVEHRASPRLVEVAMSKGDIEALRRGGVKARRLARALAQLAWNIISPQ